MHIDEFIRIGITTNELRIMVNVALVVCEVIRSETIVFLIH